MKTLNRTLTVLIFAVALALTLALIAQTGWGTTRSVPGVGEGFDGPLEPLIEITGTMLVTISATLLIQRAWSQLRPRPQRPPRQPERVQTHDSVPPETSSPAA